MKVILSFLCLFLSTATVLHAMEPMTIHDAVKEGNLAAVQRFIEQDSIVVNQPDKYRATPLHHACKEKHTEIARFLLEHGASIDAQNERGQSPLHCAALSGNAEITKLLLDHGANVHQKDNNDYTPIYGAVHLGHIAIVRLLLAQGAIANEPNYLHEVPLEWAWLWCNNLKYKNEIINLLEKWPFMQAQLALCEALDQRFNANSPARNISQDITKEIFHHLKPQDFAYHQAAAPQNEWQIARSIVDSLHQLSANRYVQISAGGVLLLATAFGTLQLCNR